MAFRFSTRTVLATTAGVAYLSVLATPLLYAESLPAIILLAISTVFLAAWLWSLAKGGEPLA
jgi:hypothetical protein